MISEIIPSFIGFFSEEKIPVFVIQLESKDIFYIASMTEHSAISRDNSQSSTIVTEMIKAYCIIQDRRNKSLIMADFTHHPRVNRSEMLIESKVINNQIIRSKTC